MKKVYLGLLISFVYLHTQAQVAVTATAGTPGPAAYTTLKAAFDAVNLGTHQGIITVTITGTTNETATATINASGNGTAAYTAISIQPVGTAVITGDIAGPLIDLNGADNITFNGLNTAGNTLTLENISTSGIANTSTVRFINDATNNTLQNCIIRGASAGLTSGTVLIGAGTFTGNDNNTITACNITDASSGTPAIAIYAAGTVGLENSNNIISANSISNYFNASLATTAVLVDIANTNWSISNNRFFQTETRTFTTANTHRCIQLNSGSGYSVNNNIIGYADDAGTGTYSLAGAVASKFVAIEMNVGTGAASNVYSNTITAISLATTSNANANTFYGVWCGIYIVAGDVNVGTLGGNTIGSTTATGSVMITPAVNSGFSVAISSNAGNTVNIENNLIGGISHVPAAANAGTLTGIQLTGTGGVISVSNNTIGNTQANNMRLGTAGATTQGGIIRGIINSNTGTIRIHGNTIQNMANFGTASTSLLRGIESQAGAGTITKNIVSNMSAGGSIANFSTQAGVGILINSTVVGQLVDSNIIYNLSLTNAATTGAVLSGIYAGVPSATTGITNGIIITRNRIYGLSNANTSTSATAPAIIAGIYCGNNNAANPMTIANNMIALGSAQNNSLAVIGIFSHYANAQNYTARIYHNSVSITGTVASGAQPSFCYYRGDFTNASSVPTIDMKNNIFSNTRSGSGVHYAIANGYPAVTSSGTGWNAGASDYNVLLSTESPVGYWSGSHQMGGWQAASAGDANSLSVLPEFVNPATDLHLVTTVNSTINNAGIALPEVTADIDNDARSTTNPDIGADEFQYQVPMPVSIIYFRGHSAANSNFLSWKVISNNSMLRFTLERSNDGRSFEPIAAFSATKERCNFPFEEADRSPLPYRNYYRVKITEADGAVSYSTIILLNSGNRKLEITSINPSPVITVTTLSLANTTEGNLNIKVADAGGRIVFTQTTKVSGGALSLPIDLSGLASGIYFLSATNGTNNALRRFVKY